MIATTATAIQTKRHLKQHCFAVSCGVTSTEVGVDPQHDISYLVAAKITTPTASTSRSNPLLPAPTVEGVALTVEPY